MTMLEGIDVLDLTPLLPGPYCTMLLGDLGADVVKVERPGTGDLTREVLPGIFYAVNRNKKGITVNMKSEEGKEIIYRLAEESDVVVEAFRPGVVERLDVDYDSIRDVNPNIVYCSISGYGQNGPYRLVPGHDLNYLSLAGAMSVPARVGQQPERSGLPVADLSSAMFATTSILAALVGRGEEDGGEYIDVSMADSVLSWMSSRLANFLLDEEYTMESEDEWNHVMPTNDVFETSDGKKVAIGVLEEHFWEALCAGLEREDLMEDERFETHEQRMANKRELHAILEEEFLRKPRDTWVEILKAEGAPVSPVNSPREALQEEQFHERDMVEEMYVPQLGRSIQQITYPGKHAENPADIRNAPPTLGEHNDDVLQSLGYSEADIEGFRDNGII